MASITELALQNVRCFEESQSARLNRITILVGENSSGKSTFMGCYKTFAKLSNLNDLGDTNHFDDQPFHMGSFDTIVRSGQKAFTLAGRFEGHCYTSTSYTFKADANATPSEQRVRLEFEGPDGAPQLLDIVWLADGSDKLRFNGPNFRFDMERSVISYTAISTWLSRYVRHGYLPFGGEPAAFRQRRGPSLSRGDEAEFAKFVTFLRSQLPLPGVPSLYVEAADPTPPARTRAYATVPPHLNTEGHRDLRNYLREVGTRLGLWKSVSVRRRADGKGTEVLVETPDGRRNLVDVGYGIHAMLPLLSAMHSKRPGTTFLFQQPEVHLHPVAQAALAQFMAESNHSFVIETHSEHFLDRLRICVMNGILPPGELAVVFFQSTSDRTKSTIHSIGVDAQANLLDVPASYRSFFIREAESLLGF